MKAVLLHQHEVEGILAGRQTQIRRVIALPSESKSWGMMFDNHPETMINIAIKKSMYQPGDILYVRETWVDLRGMGFIDANNKHWIFSFKADVKPGSDGDRARIDYGVKWHSSTTMPREAARLFLRVKDVRVQRLQDISNEDAKAEGANIANWIARGGYGGDDSPHYREAFGELWDSVNDKRGHGWHANPWVWAYEFERISEQEAQG